MPILVRFPPTAPPFSFLSLLSLLNMPHKACVGPTLSFFLPASKHPLANTHVALRSVAGPRFYPQSLRLAIDHSMQLVDTEKPDSLVPSPPSYFLVQPTIPDAIKEILPQTVPAAPSTPALTIADLLLFESLLNQKQPLSEKAKAYVDFLTKNHPELAQVQQSVGDQIKTAPILEEFRSQIISQVAALSGIASETLVDIIEQPRDPANGDFSIPLPRARPPTNPIELAASLAARFKTNNFVTAVKATGPFLNFHVNKDLLKQYAIYAPVLLGKNFGTNSLGFGKFAIIEYSSPNIAKPFHVGHLRSTIIGNFIKNVLDACGWSTFSINYLGDWGKQFGLLAVGFEKYGSEQELEQDPIKHLYEIYVKINNDASENPEIHDQARAYFKRMEDGNPDAYGLWKRFRDLSIIRYTDTYARLGIHFDLYSGESQYSLAQCQDVLEDLKSFGLLVPDQGALIVNLNQYKLGTAVIGKTDGSLLYLSRDIAAAIDRHAKYKFDAMYYVVASQQDHHFKQLFKILELMGHSWVANCHHINFGIIKTKDGNMSTRKGTVVFLQDILEAVQEEMHSVMRRNPNKYEQIPDPVAVADTLGISAVMTQDMSARRARDYVFDWARVFSFEGDTGPYLQYAHSRLCSIERQAMATAPPQSPDDDPSIDPSTPLLPATGITPSFLANVDLSLLTEPQCQPIIDIIASYPDVVIETSKTMEPCTIVNYALRLSHAVSSALDVLWVMGQPRKLAMARLALYGAAHITLANALKMLGLVPVSRM